MNISTTIERGAHYFKDKTAIIYGETSISYSMLNRAVEAIARRLVELGLQPGERAAIYMPNGPEWAAAYYGIIRAGGIVVCLSASYQTFEIEHLLNDSGSRFMMTSLEMTARIPEQSRICETNVLTFENDKALSKVFEPDGPDFSTSVLVEREKDDPCVILYTGGTTGKPKGAMLTHENILFTAQNVCFHERTRPEDKSLCFMPINHVFGGNHIMNSIFYGCGTLVLHKNFDMDDILRSITTNGVTRFYAVPTVYIRMLEQPDIEKYFKSITYCFSAATSMASEIVRQWQKRTGLTIHEAYGMTEASSLVTFNHIYRHRIGSVGTPAGIVEVQLLDADGKPAPEGETGEIVVRGPNVMKGYFGQEEATREVLRNGWLRTGDVGRFDEDGYLYVVDRIKDMIISGGLNVYPSEVEEVIYTHAEVEECVVLGLPDKEYGETVCAYVVLHKGSRAEKDDIIRHCKSYMASYKAPKKVFFVTQLPKSPTGKILRRAIKEQHDAENR